MARQLIKALIVLLAFGLSAPAFAQDLPPAPLPSFDPPAANIETPLPSLDPAPMSLDPAPAATLDGGFEATFNFNEDVSIGLEVAPLSEGELSGLSTLNASIALSNQIVTGTSSGNTVTADTINNGPINFGAGSFSAYSGMGTFVVNTGNNNTLQSIMSVAVGAGN